MSIRLSWILLAAALAVSSFAYAAADFPAGTYVASGVDVTFDHAGHFHTTVNGTTMVEGDYAVSGEQLKFSDKRGPWACPAGQTGTYRWKADADTLTFGKVADACADRVNTLTPHPWKKQS